jgi:hypothetical protein
MENLGEQARGESQSEGASASGKAWPGALTGLMEDEEMCWLNK